MQFPPGLTEDHVLKVFVNDLSRNCYFDFSKTSDKYDKVDMYMYDIQYAVMANETANPVNANYQTKITGTTNMTTTLGAWGFAAKGHYYQISDDPAVQQSIPKITDRDG